MSKTTLNQVEDNCRTIPVRLNPPFKEIYHNIIQEKGTLSQKKYLLFGNFSQMADPLLKKKLGFILHFRPLGTFLVFTKKLKFCQYFYIYFWE